MSSSLQSLLGAVPSGRRRPLFLDCDAYATAVIRQGSPVPWTDLAALTGHVGRAQALLDSDALWVDVEAWYAAHLAASPDLLTAMGERSRSGYALRTLLSDDVAVERVVATLATLADTTRRRLVLDVPSPARWLSRAHELAGTVLTVVDEDQADSASMYLAEWAGRLGALPVAVVILDARAQVADADVKSVETLADYTALSNVTAHFGWSLALRDEVAVHVAAGEPSVAVVTEEFWSAAAELPDGDVLVATVPASATPERVLDQLTKTR